MLVCPMWDIFPLLLTPCNVTQYDCSLLLRYVTIFLKFQKSNLFRSIYQNFCIIYMFLSMHCSCTFLVKSKRKYLLSVLRSSNKQERLSKWIMHKQKDLQIVVQYIPPALEISGWGADHDRKVWNFRDMCSIISQLLSLLLPCKAIWNSLNRAYRRI